MSASDRLAAADAEDLAAAFGGPTAASGSVAAAFHCTQYPVSDLQKSPSRLARRSRPAPLLQEGMSFAVIFSQAIQTFCRT